ncbi:PKD domain-containing protein, partial [Mesohalobacter halotolerans]
MKRFKFIYFTVFSIIFSITSAQDILMQDGTFNQCSGTFFDSGGAVDDYGTGEDFTITICPDMQDMRVVLDFVSFLVNNDGEDQMVIYDADTADPAQIIGTFTDDLASNPQLASITASDANLSGCLTIEFSSNTFFEAAGWEAIISCREPCPVITPDIDSVTPSVIDGNNYKVCLDDEITFDANATLTTGDLSLVTYDWDFDNGEVGSGEIASTTYSAPGLYIVSLTANYPNCNSETIDLQVQVGTEPEITLTADQTEVCLGESIQLTAQADTVPFEEECTIPVSETTFLPDSNANDSYFSTIPVDCFDDNQTLQDPNDILEVCINIEHSFLGDLDIILIAPDGTQIFFKTFPGGGGTFLGQALDDGSLDPGVGFEYCFTNTATTQLVNGPTVPTGGPTPGQAIAPGDYAPVDSFNNLVGVPLNGDWTIQITDNLGIDNGYIFEWFLNFDPDIIPPDASFEPQIVDENWTGFEGQGSQITVTPSTVGSNCYDYVVLDDFNCEFTETICVNVLPNPEIENLEDLTVCDPTFPVEFDLTVNDSNILGTQDPSLYNISYHNSQIDADNDQNPIPSPEMYTTNSLPETIYVRIEDLNGNCFETGSFMLLEAGITNGPPDNLESCFVNGEATFNLNLNNSALLDGQNASDFTIQYFESEQDAIDNVNGIVNPTNYILTMITSVTIWYRIENNDNNCFNVDSFQLEVFQTPEITTPPQDLSQCGDFTLTQTFDLTQNDAAALGIANTAETQVTYYNTQADADAGTNPITDPANYNPGSVSETIFVRAENINSADCFSVDSFTIQIFDVEANQADDIAVCTPTGNTGQTQFDLTLQNNTVFGPDQDSTTHSISYHISNADAQGGANPIPNPDNYTNTSNPQTVWVRVQNNNDPSCFAVSDFVLNIIEEPEITQTPSLSQCGDFSGTQVFDLTVNNAATLGIANAVDTQLSYYNTQADADAGTNPITDPANYNPGSTSETIFVRAENINNSNCFATASFNIQIFNVEANDPGPIVLCEATGNTGISQFDLTEQNTAIFGPNQDATTHSISYHTSFADAQGGASPIPNPDNYTNASNPQPIWARVQNITDPSCFAIVDFTISVTEEPEILNPPVTLSQCSDFTATPVFDLTQYDAANLGILNAGETQITYHNTAADANTGDNPIPNPANYQPANAQEDIFIRAANVNDSECYATADFSVEFYDVEIILPLENLENCDDGTGTATSSFDLTSNTVTVLGPNQNSSTHNVTYYETQPDATGGV